MWYSFCRLHYLYKTPYSFWLYSFNIKHWESLRVAQLRAAASTGSSHSSEESSPVTKKCCLLNCSECGVICTKSNSSKIHFQLIGWELNNNPSLCVLIHSSIMETANFSAKVLAQKIHSWSPWKTGDWILFSLSCVALKIWFWQRRKEKGWSLKLPWSIRNQKETTWAGEWPICASGAAVAGQGQNPEAEAGGLWISSGSFW